MNIYTDDQFNLIKRTCAQQTKAYTLSLLYSFYSIVKSEWSIKLINKFNNYSRQIKLGGKITYLTY